MTHHRLACALLALALLPTTSVLAQGNSRHDGKRNDSQRNNRPDDRRDNRWDERRYARPDVRGSNRGAGPEHAYYRGNRLPPQYRTYQYVVEDWRGHGLYTPPRGYHWVQTGGDYVLVAIATGIILELLLSR
jgi:Ni/Co efflux regulator RcnB